MDEFRDVQRVCSSIIARKWGQKDYSYGQGGMVAVLSVPERSDVEFWALGGRFLASWAISFYSHIAVAVKYFRLVSRPLV